MGNSRAALGSHFPPAVWQRLSLCPFEHAAEVLIAAPNDGSLDAEIAASLAALGPEEAERIVGEMAEGLARSNEWCRR